RPVPRSAGLQLERRRFGLRGAGHAPQRDWRPVAGAAHHRKYAARLPADDRGDRGLRATRLDRRPRARGLQSRRHAALGRVQARQMARYRADAARLGRGRYGGTLAAPLIAATAAIQSNWSRSWVPAFAGTSATPLPPAASGRARRAPDPVPDRAARYV